MDEPEYAWRYKARCSGEDTDIFYPPRDKNQYKIIASQAKELGTENLLLVASVYILFMVVLFNIIWHREKHNFVSEKYEVDVDKKTSRKESFQIIRSSKYLILVLLVVGLIKIVTAQTEWQYNKFVDHHKEKHHQLQFLILHLQHLPD